MAIVHVTNENFQAEVLESDKPVLLDFWATWCGPCKMIAPIVEEIAQERPDVKVCKVDVDTQPELAIQFKVISIPTILIFRNAEVVNKAVGLRSKEQLLQLL